MATLTSRLGLTKPTDAEDVSVSQLNMNADLIDASIGATPATSTTRPSTQLFEGRTVHEADTGELAIRRNNAWAFLGVVTATADRLARRTTGGRLKVGTAVDPDDAVTKAQLDAISTTANPVFTQANLITGATVGPSWDVTGLFLARYNRQLFVQGIAGRPSWVNGETIMILPTGWRPMRDCEWFGRTGVTYFILVLEAATGQLRIYIDNSAGTIGGSSASGNDVFAVIGSPCLLA